MSPTCEPARLVIQSPPAPTGRLLSFVLTRPEYGDECWRQRHFDESPSPLLLVFVRIKSSSFKVIVSLCFNLLKRQNCTKFIFRSSYWLCNVLNGFRLFDLCWLSLFTRSSVFRLRSTLCIHFPKHKTDLVRCFFCTKSFLLILSHTLVLFCLFLFTFTWFQNCIPFLSFQILITFFKPKLLNSKSKTITFFYVPQLKNMFLLFTVLASFIQKINSTVCLFPHPQNTRC